MSRFLLDTSVVSEVTKARPSPQVTAFLEEQEDLWLPTIVLHELEFGLLLLPEGQRQDMLRTALSAFIAAYDDRILPLDSAAAEWAARFRAHARRSGETLDLGVSVLIVKPDRPDRAGSCSPAVSPREFLDAPRR